MAFSLDDVQRSVKVCTTTLEGIRNSIPITNLDALRVAELLAALQDVNSISQDCSSIAMKFINEYNPVDTSYSKYLSKIRVVSNLANATKRDINNILTSKAILEVKRLKIDENYFNWLPVLLSIVHFKNSRAYWTYAIDPNSPADNPTNSLYYKVDIFGLSAFVNNIYAEVAKPSMGEKPQRPITVNEKLTDTSSYWYPVPNAEEYNKIDVIKSWKKSIDNTMVVETDVSLWISPIMMFNQGRKYLSQNIYKTPYNFPMPIVSSYLPTPYTGQTPLSTALQLASSMQCCIKDVKKLSRFRSIIQNPALYGTV
jgi:hypothetical protein